MNKNVATKHAILVKHKSSQIPLIISILLAPCIYSPLPFLSVMAQTDSIANERIPVKARDLESHWGVDCDTTLENTKRYLANQGEPSSEYAPLLNDVTKCVHIYNTPDTAHFADEPDFRHLLDKLADLAD